MGKRKGSLGKTPGLDFLTVIALIAAAIVALFPVLWGLSTALKTDSAVTMFPPEIIPKEITWNNFIDVVTKSDFMIYMKNSLLITLISIVMATFVAAHAAYALTFFNIRFRKGISFFILMTSMVPPVALLSAVYVWNDYLVSSSFITASEKKMISVGLYQYITQYGIKWGLLMAAVMISIIPIIILFICLQKRFVEGMAAGAVKG